MMLSSVLKKLCSMNRTSPKVKNKLWKKQKKAVHWVLFPSGPYDLFFDHEVFRAHFIIHMIHEHLQRALHPGFTREADQPHVFKCLSLAAPLGQAEVRTWLVVTAGA